MHRSRRAFLGGVVGASIGVLPGCSSSSDRGRATRSSPTDEPTVRHTSSTADGSLQLRVDDPTAAPGTTGTVDVTAANVGAIQPAAGLERLTPSGPRFTLDLDMVEFDPEPDRVLMSAPPYWVWAPPADRVTVRIPFRVPKSADPGRYAFSLTGWPTPDMEMNDETVRFEITVRAAPHRRLDSSFRSASDPSDSMTRRHTGPGLTR